MKKELLKKAICSSLQEELREFTNTKYYICPVCGKIFEWDDAQYNPEEKTYTCESCLTTIDETYIEHLTMCDYIEQMYLSYKEKNNEGI